MAMQHHDTTHHEGGQDLYAPTRPAKSNWAAQSSPIVEARTVTGRSLTVVISIMCFLACLTAGAVYIINQSANAWSDSIASEITIQIAPQKGENIEDKISKIAFFLSNEPGIQGVRPLPIEESAALLEPWLGKGVNLKDLPFPRLIAIDIDRSSPPDIDGLRGQLMQNYSNITLDDHRFWQNQIQTVTRSLAIGGLAVLTLVGLATTAIIVSATRSSMSSNREIVEVLHFVGATDRFIAKEFEKHFLSLGIKAGLVGAGAAIMVFLFMPFILQFMGSGAMTSAEIRRLVGTATLDLPGYMLMGIVVIVIAALCTLTTRYGVFRILHSDHDN